ncbi:MAG: phosphotransferase [Candidatus Nanopelagicales bacterium]
MDRSLPAQVPRPPRPQWDELPALVRRGIEQAVGGSLTPVKSLGGGYGPGLASLMERDDGHRFFLKAVSAGITPEGPDIYRRERGILERLPRDAPISQLTATHTDGDWVALVFEEIQGRNPDWSREGDLDLVLSAMSELADSFTPSPVAAPIVTEVWDEEFAGFRALARQPEQWQSQVAGVYGQWAAEHLEQLAQHERDGRELVQGTTLLHGDLRDDNILIAADDSVVFVDWPQACIGAAWFDLLLMLPSIALKLGAQSAERIVRTHTHTRDVEAQTINCALAAVAGFFVEGSFQPAPIGLPTVRDFQRAQGKVAVEWLQTRLEG